MTCTWAPERRPSARPQRSELVEAPWEYTTVYIYLLLGGLHVFIPAINRHDIAGLLYL